MHLATLMIFEVLTLFPEIIENYLSTAMMKRAAAAGVTDFRARNIRDYATDKHRVTDDMPFGGGPGMVMKPEPIAAAIDATKADHLHTSLPVIYLSPQGEQWSQPLAEEFSRLPGLILLCGRYEGLDQRIIETRVDREISVGDYILTGGELGALIMIDSITRLLPGVLGNCDSAAQDSFSNDGLLDCPHYTRPETWDGLAVPPVLLSGHHGNVAAWRRMMSLKQTKARRPDIFARIEPGLSKSDRKLLRQIEEEKEKNEDNNQ